MALTVKIVPLPQAATNANQAIIQNVPPTLVLCAPAHARHVVTTMMNVHHVLRVTDSSTNPASLARPGVLYATPRVVKSARLITS